ncbi:MAG: hypothetical protein IJX25_00240 [Clostridia bacterium]|nr:hypothetical protein [Clostridia bacterium]
MSNMMQKLNTMGQVPQLKQPAKYGGAQIINVTYGHNGGGKLYSYYGTNKRVGDIVTPEVTHPKSGKTYKTLAVVRSTHNAGKGVDTVNYLQQKQPGANGEYINRPRNLKWIGKTDQKSLPGYYPGWEKDAQARKELQYETQMRDDIPEMQKLSLLREIRKMK